MRMAHDRRLAFYSDVRISLYHDYLEGIARMRLVNWRGLNLKPKDSDNADQAVFCRETLVRH